MFLITRKNIFIELLFCLQHTVFLTMVWLHVYCSLSSENRNETAGICNISIWFLNGRNLSFLEYFLLVHLWSSFLKEEPLCSIKQGWQGESCSFLFNLKNSEGICKQTQRIAYGKFCIIELILVAIDNF